MGAPQPVRRPDRAMARGQRPGPARGPGSARARPAYFGRKSAAVSAAFSLVMSTAGAKVKGFTSCPAR